MRILHCELDNTEEPARWGVWDSGSRFRYAGWRELPVKTGAYGQTALDWLYYNCQDYDRLDVEQQNSSYIADTHSRVCACYACCGTPKYPRECWLGTEA